MGQLLETLEKFQNGEARYIDDPVFCTVVNKLAGGLGPFAVLDRVLKEFKDSREGLEKIVATKETTIKMLNAQIRDLNGLLNAPRVDQILTTPELYPGELGHLSEYKRKNLNKNI